MKFLRLFFDFYINCSIHVAFSVYSLVRMTQYMFSLPSDNASLYFAFFGTIVGYNFVKYDALARTQKLQMSIQLKAIATLSFISLFATGYFFFQLQRVTQITGIIFLIITLLYTLPFFPNRKNARNWAGIKIYIVALTWVGVTVFLPILNSKVSITSDFYLKSLQRFILVFVLILIFEIIDLKHDDPHLKTVPQQIGVKRTKILGYILLLVFCLLEIFNSNGKDILITNYFSLSLQLIIAVIMTLFLYFSNENKSKYFSAFWAESIPIVWWLILFL
jgi:hypothetical protein